MNTQDKIKEIMGMNKTNLIEYVKTHELTDKAVSTLNKKSTVSELQTMIITSFVAQETPQETPDKAVQKQEGIERFMPKNNPFIQLFDNEKEFSKLNKYAISVPDKVIVAFFPLNANKEQRNIVITAQHKIDAEGKKAVMPSIRCMKLVCDVSIGNIDFMPIGFNSGFHDKLSTLNGLLSFSGKNGKGGYGFSQSQINSILNLCSEFIPNDNSTPTDIKARPTRKGLL